MLQVPANPETWDRDPFQLTREGAEGGGTRATAHEVEDQRPGARALMVALAAVCRVAGDLLYGRGTTDCLGHVALITELLIQVRHHGREQSLTHAWS